MAERDAHNNIELPEFIVPPSLLIVIAPYYRAIAENQTSGARVILESVNARADQVEVPGALEIPTAIRLASQSKRYEGYVALGCVIRGETTHYDTVCNDSSRALSLLGIDHGLCIGNGILTCETMAQAEERADPAKMDKGGGAAAAALHLIAVARRFGPTGPKGSAVETPDDSEFMMAAARQPRIA